MQTSLQRLLAVDKSEEELINKNDLLTMHKIHYKRFINRIQ